jgi:hypothetical protein
MKNAIKIFLFTLIIGAGSIISNEAKSQSANVNFSIFYNSLKPYGRWMNNSSYGQVWVSNTRGFTPYSTGGHWAYTDYGWTWVSDYDWGWAPFHYGRWSYNSTYGWYWIPGYEWAPAWVAWRNNNDYYGWAPLSPGLNISIGISAYNSIPSGRWVFAPHRYITSPNVNRYYVPRSRNVTIIKNTTVINNVNVRNNVHYVSGPKREDVERVNHEKIQTYTVSNSTKPGRTVVNNKTVNVYRPVINNDKTVVNNNNKTVNKNSNNTTVNKNSNNKTVTKNTDKETTNNKKVTNKKINKTTKESVKKKPKEPKKPNNPPDKKQVNNNKQKSNSVQHSVIAKKNQQKKQYDVAKRKNKNPDVNNKRKK